MPTEIRYGTRFRKQYAKADKKIKTTFAQALELFVENPSHPSLRNHRLRGKFAGYRSMDITDDWRALFSETKTGSKRVIVFYNIGTHKDLYGGK